MTTPALRLALGDYRMSADISKGEMIPLRVARAAPIAEGISVFELRRPDGADLAEFTPGAHVAVQVPNGLIRKYSLCNDPDERDRYCIAVKREARENSGSTSMVESAKAGDMLPVSAPRNNFALAKSPAGYTFIAGGIGITPIMSMIRHLTNTGTTLFKLYYCTRSPQMTAFREELTAPPLKSKIVIHHDDGDPERNLDLWPILERPKGHVYCCGPRPMMQAVRDMTGHWSPSAVHFEAFTEPPKQAPNDRPFKVRLAKSGTVVEVPVGTTILEALRAHGLDVPSSCESGTCGTCRTKLISGEADHRDLVLSEHEHANNIMVCVSRARSDELVIDR
jgi:phthalate 4,5-dioxygenase reductase subunit